MRAAAQVSHRELHQAAHAERHCRSLIGSSDARTIMGTDETAIIRQWREKRDYSNSLTVELGVATEPLNQRWLERTTWQVIKYVQTWIGQSVIRWMLATLDGIATAAILQAAANRQDQPAVDVVFRSCNPSSILRDNTDASCFQRCLDASARFIRPFWSGSRFHTFDSWKRIPCTVGQL